MSAALRGRPAKPGLAAIVFWCAITFAAFDVGAVQAGEKLLVDVKTADARIDRQTQSSIIFVKLTEDSRKQFAEFTQRNAGKKIEIRFEGTVLMKPVIREPLMGGVFEAWGQLSLNEARDIVKKLATGAKVEIEVVD